MAQLFKFNSLFILFELISLPDVTLTSKSKAFRSVSLYYELLLSRDTKVTKKSLGVPTREWIWSGSTLLLYYLSILTSAASEALVFAPSIAGAC